MSVSDKVTLSGSGAYIASLEREIAALRASRDALIEALEAVHSAANTSYLRRIAREALAAAQSNKGEAS
jgi:hypothetical protein